MLGALAVGIVSYLNPAPTQRPASKLPGAAKPLWKPEPGVLLADTALNLTVIQRQRIGRVERRWIEEKAPLLAAMESYRPKQGNLAGIRGELESFSDISRRYDLERDRYWKAAESVLTPAQSEKFTGGRN